MNGGKYSLPWPWVLSTNHILSNVSIFRPDAMPIYRFFEVLTIVEKHVVVMNDQILKAKYDIINEKLMSIPSRGIYIRFEECLDGEVEHMDV